MTPRVPFGIGGMGGSSTGGGERHKKVRGIKRLGILQNWRLVSWAASLSVFDWCHTVDGLAHDNKESISLVIFERAVSIEQKYLKLNHKL